MVSKRPRTWPSTSQSDGQVSPRPKFALVRSGELHDPQSSSEPEVVEKQTSYSQLRKFCHSLGLETVYLLFQEIGGQNIVEEKKIAILGDLRSACSVSLLHIIPAGASVTLFAFNWNGYYIGSELSGPSGEDGLKFLGLQFAAKILELLAMASLSTILFAVVRAQLISDYLPLGAVTAGFEFKSLSLLWSKEFVATCTKKFSSASKKAFLITTIFVFTLLGAVIGPSAAVSSQPVLRNWAAGGTVFWLNATSQDLWPSNLDRVASSDLPCNSSRDTSCFPLNYKVLAGEMLSLWPSPSPLSTDDGTQVRVMPEKVLISGRQSMQTMATRFRGPFIYQPDITVATAPLAAISDAIAQMGKYWFIANQYKCVFGGRARFCHFNDITHTIDAMQPVSYVKCSSSLVNATLDFPRLDQQVGNYPLVDYSNSTIGSRQWFDESTRNGTNPTLSWVELPESSFGRTSIGAVVALPGDQILACTIDARWANATTTLTFLGGPMIASGLPTNWFSGGQLQLGSNGQPLWPSIKLAPGWAESINPIISNASNSVFSTLCNSVGRLGNISMAQRPFNAVESILALMITDGLVRTSSTATTLGSLKGLDNYEWTNEILPTKSVFGNGGSSFTYSPQEGDQFTKFQAKVSVNGYGYAITTATFLSTLVLLIYSIIAMLYVFYSICFAKTTSNSWESISELVALALNSRQDPAMRNTGAGIATMGTLRQDVGIRVSDDCLQMVFKGNDGDGVEKIRITELYG